MSILIKGMEMPKACYECVLSWVGVCDLENPYYISDTRAQGCPLVEVPTPHSRLIDTAHIVCTLGEEKYMSIDDLLSKYTSSPVVTIIEAEE